MDRPPVVLLIQEEAGLLAVFHIYNIADAVLGDQYFGIEGFCEEAFFTRHAFQLTDLGVAALIDAAHFDPVLSERLHQSCQNVSLEAVDAERQGFHDQHVFIFIDGQTGQEIRFAKQKAAAGRVDHFLSVLPRALHALCQKRGRHGLVFAAGQEADSDLGFPVDEPVSHEVSVEVLDRDDIAILKVSAELRDLVVIDPQAAGFDRAPFSLLQDSCRAYGQVLLAAYIIVMNVKR